MAVSVSGLLVGTQAGPSGLASVSFTVTDLNQPAVLGELHGLAVNGRGKSRGELPHGLSRGPLNIMLFVRFTPTAR